VVSFRVWGIYLQPNYPFEFVAVLWLSFFVSSVLKYINEDKNKKMLSKALSEYVSSDIAHEILHSTWNVNLSGENKRITTFFSDIAGFTTLSEKLSPEELVWFLREYLWEMSNIIIDHKWFVNKYEWDAIMALWWVFGRVENYWVNEACYAALLQQKRLQELNDMWKSKWKDTFQVRMWIHTWNAIIWNIGAEGRKMEFTALWDTVNLGSRLEWVNKYYNTHICVSHDVYEVTKELFEYRMLDKIRVKWKNNALYIYELVWEKDTLSDLKKQSLDMFDLALKKYFEKNFSEAKLMFENLVKLWDEPSKIYVDRCKKLLEIPPQSDWDGVWSMTDK
jgi:adenylate cyclase